MDFSREESENLFPTSGMPILFTLVFVVILGIILFRLVSGMGQWHSNNQKAVLTVQAKVVTKRTEVHRHTTNNNGGLVTSNSTTYFVTFEVQSGDRMELRVHGRDYGLMAEGDVGELSFQGTRFLGFRRF